MKPPPIDNDPRVVKLPGGPYWHAVNGHLVAKTLRSGDIELLAAAHHFREQGRGAFVRANGGRLPTARRMVSLGFFAHVASEREGARSYEHFVMHETPEVLDLAARCAFAASAVKSFPKDGEGFRARGLSWRDVPDVLPRADWIPGARVCPGCLCDPDHPCTVVLDDGCGEGVCMAAGVFDLPKCSACT